MNAIPVSYGGADILKVSVSFNYDRYIMNPEGSISKGSQDTFEDIVTRTSGDTVVFNHDTVSTPEPASGTVAPKPAGESKPPKEPNPVPAKPATLEAKPVGRFSVPESITQEQTSRMKLTSPDPAERKRISLEALKALEDK